MFPFIIFNLTQNMNKPPPHGKCVELRRIIQIQKKFIVDLIFKFNFQFYHQIKFCLTCKCNINGFQTTNPHIKLLVFVNKYQLVHIFRLKMTSLKCNQNSSNRKNKLCFFSIWLAWNSNICCANITTIGNLFCSLCHQDKAHLLFSTSIEYWWSPTSSLNIRSQ